MTQALRSTRSPLLLLVVVGLVAGSACNKDEDEDKDKPAEPGQQGQPAQVAPGQPLPGPPPAGTDADKKKIAAQELATSIDAALATFTRAEQEIPPSAAGRGRNAEAWSAAANGKPAMPKKVVIQELDDKGNVLETTDYYFNDSGRLTLARASDGLFIFDNELLAVWLDREQRVKRGVSPGVINQRVEALKKEMVAALGVFNLR